MIYSKYHSIEEIKQAIHPIAFYSRELQEMKSNVQKKWIVAGLCPFHEDRHTGSFYIHSQTGSFICHSCGTKGKDIIAFLERRYQLTFKEAIEKLINEWRM